MFSCTPVLAETVVIDITAQNIAFNLDTVTVPAGATVIVNFNNMDNGIPHTFSVYTDTSASTPIFVGSTITGPSSITYTFIAPASPGTNFFRCDIHPSMMNGQFIVTAVEPTQTPTPSPTPTITQTLTPSPTPTITQTPTPSPTPTITQTLTPSPTPTITQTPTPSPTPTITQTLTPTPTPTITRTPTITPTPVPGNLTDLTNRYSPEASTYTTYPSVTRLHEPSEEVGLEKIADGFNSPIMVTYQGDKNGNIYVVDQTGVVWLVYPNGTVMDKPYFDIRDRMVALNTRYDERGLLSIAFHPNYSSNGRIYAFYSAPLREGGPENYSCTNRLSEFHISTTDPNKIDIYSEKILLEIDKPQMNHNGGAILFGPDDGYLYLPLGDGGAADDKGPGHNPAIGNGQDLTRILGKLIRIDVDHISPGKQYAIPPDNPFLSNSSILPEIYAYGLRNPAYATVDSGPGHHMVLAMAGQHLFESVLVVYKGANYPWNIREGTHGFNSSDNSAPLPEPCPITGYSGQSLIGPVVELGHDLGIVVVGGTVYRGTMLEGWQGKYIFGTWSDSFSSGNGNLLIANPVLGPPISQLPSEEEQVTPESNSMWATSMVDIRNNPDNRLHSYMRGVFEGPDHEAYLLINYEAGPGITNKTGSLWKLVPPDTAGLIPITPPKSVQAASTPTPISAPITRN